MKKIVTGIVCSILFSLIVGCSSNTDPQLRIQNEQINKVNLKVQTSRSNKILFDNVEPGQTTEYQTASEGNITATDVIRNESVSFLAEKNTRYTILISTGNPPSFHIDK